MWQSLLLLSTDENYNYNALQFKTLIDIQKAPKMSKPQKLSR